MKELISNKVAWIDLISPNDDELDALKNELKIPEKVVNQIRITANRNKMEFYKDFFYAVLYFPIWDETEKTSKPVELNIIVFKNYIITIRYSQTFVPLNEFIQLCETCNKTERENLLGTTTYESFYHIVQCLLEFSQRQLKHIEEKIVAIENEVFNMDPLKNNQKLIYKTLTIKRDLLGFRRIFLTLQNSLVGLDYKGEEFWGNSAKPYLLDLINDSHKVWNNIEHHNNLLHSLEDTLYALINHNIGNLTKIYTIISLIAWPTLLIMSWYQTNTTSLPFINRPLDSYIVFIIAILPSITIYWYLRKNKLI